MIPEIQIIVHSVQEFVGELVNDLQKKYQTELTNAQSEEETRLARAEFDRTMHLITIIRAALLMHANVVVQETIITE